MAKKIQYNHALTTSFQLVIPGMEEINYFVQNTEVPGMNFMGIRADYQNHQGTMPNNKIEYDMLNISFIVDEDYTNHSMLHLWMHRLRASDKPLLQEMKDITLHLRKSTKAKNMAIKFYGAHPVMITPIPLESATTDATPVICTASFMYQYYNMEEVDSALEP